MIFNSDSYLSFRFHCPSFCLEPSCPCEQSLPRGCALLGNHMSYQPLHPP